MPNEDVQARAAVERATIETKAITGKADKRPAMGPIRYNLEAFGVAILGAVLLKWFCIEAFAIPTSSMQPTLMGSFEAGVYDRLLVDKLTPAIRDPQRWDVTVFSYPLQKNQNYVKRLVGMPGEKLDIAGGNLYRVEESEDGRVYETLRKPDRIQQDLWKEVYPARLLMRSGDTKSLGEFFSTRPQRAWKEGAEPGSFTAELKPGRSYRLSFRDRVDGGMVNRVFDGYPTDTAKAIRSGSGQGSLEIVPDVRIEATVTPTQKVDELTMAIEVHRPDFPTLTYALAVAGGTAKFQVLDADGKPQSEHSGFACEFPAGVATQLGFAHLDDELIAYRDGDEVMRFDVSDYHCRQGCELPLGADGDSPEQRVVPMLLLEGDGEVAIDGLTISRDLHYTRVCSPGMGTGKLAPDALIAIPEGHYFMMGDNTLQSVDSRGWTALTLGVTPDGTVIPPEEIPNHEGARKLRGNARIIDPSKPPDRDETPVVISTKSRLAMIDENGDTHALKAKALVTTSDSGRNQLSIQSPGTDNPTSDWTPPEEWVAFVPREHIRGRALVTFWRTPFPRLLPIR